MNTFFIGWDVGGWNCDNNSKSRDAIVVLNADRQIVGTPWRGNLRVTINKASNTQEWVNLLFALCQASVPAGVCPVTISIDTPLGFSESFISLANLLKPVSSIGKSDTNPYLFRFTERFLWHHDFKPLSAVKDMIGSQATKGMHVLAKFASKSLACGVWTDNKILTAIEAYPSVCKCSAIIHDLRSCYSPLKHEDEEDALTCALIAYLFTKQRDHLVLPPVKLPSGEGWIWVPKDVLRVDDSNGIHNQT